MTTSLPPRRGTSPFNPGATTSQQRPYTSQLPSRAKSRTENRRSALDTDSADAANDKNTVALIRRVLCPDASTYGSSAPRPLQELLPPLTSSNDVDLQLYALIAVIIKEFVYSWYARITPDHIFVDEVLQLIAHCTRALEQRLRPVDVGQLILDEVTGLIQAHITAYRIAAQDSGLVSTKSSTREIYHKLNPHPGLSPVPDVSDVLKCTEQLENENLYRHLLAQGVLAVLLPTEDLENVCLRTLVEDVLSDLILGNQVSGRICEGWFIWTTIGKIITLAKQRDAEPMVSIEQNLDATTELNRLERYGLLSDDRDINGNASTNDQSTMSIWLWKMLYSIYLAYVTVRFIIGGLLHTAFSKPEVTTTEANPADHITTFKITNQSTLCRPVLSYRALGLISQLIGVPQRMPWLSGSLSLIQSLILTGPGKLGEAGGVLDRYLRDLIGTYVLTPTILPVVLFTVRTTLFPSNARPVSVSPTNNAVNQLPTRPSVDLSSPTIQQQQGPSSDSARRADLSESNIEEAPSTSAPVSSPGDNTPTPSEVAAIKRQCAADILSLIPDSIARAFFGGSAESRASDIRSTGAKGDVTNMRDDRNQDSDDHDEPPSIAKSSSRAIRIPTFDSDGKGEETDLNTEEILAAIESDLLDPFSDSYCNKHLIFAIVEMVLVKLVPELSERSISGLMEERGVIS